MTFKKITIIGLGLLGGSVGLAVGRAWPGCRRTGCAHREGSLVTAESVGAIDDWSLDPATAVADADVVVLAMPVGLIPQWIERVAEHLTTGSIVTDVGSTKDRIVEVGDRFIGKQFKSTGAFFVGSHPMAGSDRTGVAMARADLFDGAMCIVTRSPATNPAAARKIEGFWQKLRMRTAVHTPADHDRLVALVSHLPHVVAAALVRVQDQSSLALHGRGFIDTTRIAGGDPSLWRDILLDNRENVSAAIEVLIAELSSLHKLLGNDSRATAGGPSGAAAALKVGQDVVVDREVLDWLKSASTLREKLNNGND